MSDASEHLREYVDLHMKSFGLEHLSKIESRAILRSEFYRLIEAVYDETRGPLVAVIVAVWIMQRDDHELASVFLDAIRERLGYSLNASTEYTA